MVVSFESRKTMRVDVFVNGEPTGQQALISDDGLLALSIEGQADGEEIYHLIKQGIATGINIKANFTETEGAN